MESIGARESCVMGKQRNYHIKAHVLVVIVSVKVCSFYVFLVTFMMLRIELLQIGRVETSSMLPEGMREIDTPAVECIDIHRTYIYCTMGIESMYSFDPYERIEVLDMAVSLSTGPAAKK